MNVAVVAWIEAVLAAAVVVYILWTNRRDRVQSTTTYERQQLMLELQRELNRHETTLLGRCSELERKLDQQARTLKYLRRRLS
jgi:uncharacterized protein HemX